PRPLFGTLADACDADAGSEPAQDADWNIPKEDREIQLARAQPGICAEHVLIDRLRRLLNEGVEFGRPSPPVTRHRSKMPADCPKKLLPLPRPRECDHMAGVPAGDRQRFISSTAEKVGKFVPQRQQAPHQGELDTPIAPMTSE